MISNSDPIVIIGSARTPIGSFQGCFSSLKGSELGAAAITAAVQRSKLSVAEIDSVIMGCVLAAGMGQAPARQAAILAGLPKTVTCSTINKVCGSGMKAIMLASDALSLGRANVLVAGGLESMTNAPYLLDKARAGYRMGHGVLKDHMFTDGLEDAYTQGKLMGYFAEQTAAKYQFSRQDQDQYAIDSATRAATARDRNLFTTDYEITPITVKTKQPQPTVISQDEQIAKIDLAKIPLLKPAFQDNGTITAANASSIADGAAALVLMRASVAKQHNLQPLAKILGYVEFAHEPAWFTTAPIHAIKLLLKNLHWTVTTPDLYEINEAFAVVTMAAMAELNIPHDQVNIHGGACALGHPLGGSGARIITTLLSALKSHNKTLGVASLCIGGGEATAMAIELLN